MEIRIQLDHAEPPEGRLSRVDRSGGATEADTVEFAGWLGLLRALSRAVEGGHETRARPG